MNEVSEDHSENDDCAFCRGTEAFRQGLSATDNPYHESTVTDEYGYLWLKSDYDDLPGQRPAAARYPEEPTDHESWRAGFRVGELRRNRRSEHE